MNHSLSVSDWSKSAFLYNRDLENAGHGGPPIRQSRLLNFCRSTNDRKKSAEYSFAAPILNGVFGEFNANVAAQSGSKSVAPIMSHPAWSKPISRPPPPENIDRQVGR